MKIRKGTNYLHLIYTNWQIQFIYLTFSLLWDIASNILMLLSCLFLCLLQWRQTFPFCFKKWYCQLALSWDLNIPSCFTWVNISEITIKLYLLTYRLAACIIQQNFWTCSDQLKHLFHLLCSWPGFICFLFKSDFLKKETVLQMERETSGTNLTVQAIQKYFLSNFTASGNSLHNLLFRNLI